MAGNIVKIKEGSYRLRYQDHSKYVKAKNDSQAEKLLAAYITEIESGDFTQPSKVTFKEFTLKWLREYAEVELAPKTVHSYKDLLENRTYLALGDRKLDKIKPLDLVEFYNSMRKNHKYNSLLRDGKRVLKESTAISENSISHYHKLISSIFEKAIKWGILRGVNPAKRVDAPKFEKKKARCYDHKQVQALLYAL